MAEPKKPPKKPLRRIDPSFVALGPSGVSIRDRLKGLTPADETVLRLVGEHLGSLASKDLKTRCACSGKAAQGMDAEAKDRASQDDESEMD